MSTLFRTICSMSLVGTFVILLVLTVRLCLLKCPRWLSYLLWSVVFLRLIWPVFPNSPFSLVPRSITVSQNTDRMRELEMEADAIEERAEPQGDPNENMISDFPAFGQSPEMPENLPSSTQKPAAGRAFSWMQVLTVIWALGTVVLLGYHIISYEKLKRQLSDAAMTESGVYEIKGEHLSFVLGFLHPRIYLSADLEPEERRLVLCHESVHVRRRDYLVKPVCLVISCIHWFNPFVWLAFHLMNRDMEISCDEQVVRELGEESKESYSRALLEAAKRTGVKMKKQSGVCALLSFGEDSVKERIFRVLRYRKAPVWILAAGVVLVLLLAGGLLFDPSPEMDEYEALVLVEKVGEYQWKRTSGMSVCFLRDYDGDGKKEAFVLTGSGEEEGWLQGDLWFVSSDKEASCLMEGVNMKQDPAYFESGKECFFLFSYIEGNPLLTNVYGVQNGKPVEIPFASGEEKYVEGDTLICMVSAYDMSYDCEMELFTGHTQKPYPYYYENGAFHLYPAEELSREQVKAYENGTEILEAIEAAHPGSQYQYLLRENGLLHINRAEQEGDYLTFAYTTCQITGSRMSLLSEGEGCYQKDFADEQEESFINTVVSVPAASGMEWLGAPSEYRAFAEQVRYCIEQEDVAGMYKLMADSIHTGNGQIELSDEEAFEKIYPDLFTPEVKEAVLSADLNQLFFNWQGVCIGSGVIWFQPYTQSDGSILYKIYSINQPGMGTIYGAPDLKREWRNLCQQQGATAERADEWYERMLEDGVMLENSYQFLAFFMGDWDLNGSVDWIFLLELRDGAIVTDAYEERWLYIYKNGSLVYEKASPEDPVQEIEDVFPEFTLEPSFEIW